MSTRGNPFSDSRSGDLTVVNIDLDKAPTPTASPTMGPKAQPAPNRLEVIQSVAAYSACSATMLLINKMVMHEIPLPSIVSVIQFASSCLAVAIVHGMGKTEIERFRQDELNKYLIYVAAFVAGLFCNMRSLQLSNVETVIVFRSCTPLAQVFLDYLFLNHALPSARSLLALSGVALGAYAYMRTDSEFQLKGYDAYYWVSLYFALLCFQMTYGKMMSNAMKYSLSSTVLYNNGLAIVPMFALGIYGGELRRMWEIEITAYGYFMLLLSCVVGTGISYSGWWCRSLTTATTYTTLGVMCKFATVLLNMLVWDNHAAPAGIAALLICLSAGAMYKEAPLRSASIRPKVEE